MLDLVLEEEEGEESILFVLVENRKTESGGRMCILALSVFIDVERQNPIRGWFGLWRVAVDWGGGTNLAVGCPIKSISHLAFLSRAVKIMINRCRVSDAFCSSL